MTLNPIASGSTGRWRPVREAGHEHARHSAIVLLSLERLERLGMFRLEYLNEYKIRLENTRAKANEELVESLQEREWGDSARFDEMQRYWETLRKDPDDVFFHARDRRQQIKEQIKELQEGLARQKPKAKKKSRR